MIKFSKKSIFFITLAIILVLILSRVYLNNRIANNDSLLADYTKRQQNLLNQQQQLQDMIIDLNNTLQAELTNQNALSEQLTSLTGAAAKTTSTSSNPPPTTSTRTTPTPVTRAS